MNQQNSTVMLEPNRKRFIRNKKIRLCLASNVDFFCGVAEVGLVELGDGTCCMHKFIFEYTHNGTQHRFEGVKMAEKMWQFFLSLHLIVVGEECL